MFGIRYFLVAAGLAASALVFQPAAQAHDYVLGALKIDHPWARPTVTTRQPGAGFFAIENTGETDARLIEVRPVGFAEAIEIHDIVEDDGIFRMRAMHDGLVIPAGETVALEPGGKHLMMFGLSEPLTEGEAPEVVMVFEDLGEIIVRLTVEYPQMDAPEPAHDHHDH